jgi:acetylornithine deacetylase/succinyl-diaminopimelate desuccinylase-like protein
VIRYDEPAIADGCAVEFYRVGGRSPAMSPSSKPIRVDRRRLLEIAHRLMAEYSPTGLARPALDALAQFLAEEGFDVERPEAGHPSAPAVAVRLSGSGSGPTLQFNGHLDTVHLPFVPPRVAEDRLTGTGASDMKGGTAAAVEALLAFRDAGAVETGAILLTAHDLHEAPWGGGRQLDTLIRTGYVGDAALLPEPLRDPLPVVGRGQACWRLQIARAGLPVHEVMRPPHEPNVIEAGAEFVRRWLELDRSLSACSDPLAGRSTAFVGRFHAGEIYNGFPKTAELEGTRRWLPGG